MLSIFVLYVCGLHTFKEMFTIYLFLINTKWLQLKYFEN